MVQRGHGAEALSDHHEQLTDRPVEGPSNRRFGIVVGGILLGLAALRSGFGGIDWLTWSLGIVGAGLLVSGLLLPAALGPANRAWMKLAELLHLVVNPLVMAVVYLTTLVPIGALMRLLGKDPLERRLDPALGSYWKDRIESEPPSTMKNQY